MANFGISFFPDQTQDGPRPDQSSAQPLQEAVRILSLRLPRGAPGQAVAPAGLLEAPGGGGLAPAMLMAILQRLLMGGMMPGTMPGGMPGGIPAPAPAPAPRIIPAAQGPHVPLPGGPAPSLVVDQPAARNRYGDWMNTERRLNQRPIFRGVKTY